MRKKNLWSRGSKGNNREPNHQLMDTQIAGQTRCAKDKFVCTPDQTDEAKNDNSRFYEHKTSRERGSDLEI